MHSVFAETKYDTWKPSTSPETPTPANSANVRYGKAMRGSPPKQRSVLTVYDWIPDILQEWYERGRTHMTGGLALFPNDRLGLVSEAALSERFRRYRDDLGLSPGLDFHSLRRSYVTHLIEDGFDALFVQRQVGHEYASTTALYTFVSSDYQTRTLRRVLEQTLSDARNLTNGTPE
ncbi:MAG: xerD 2 [Subtercola sp.]|nr:xerD 2 [Subtercola sp.]